MAGVGDLLAKEPLSHSGAQSVFPLNPGRKPSEEENFDRLRTMNYVSNIRMQNRTRKLPEKGKSQGAES